MYAKKTSKFMLLIKQPVSGTKKRVIQLRIDKLCYIFAYYAIALPFMLYPNILNFMLTKLANN